MKPKKTPLRLPVSVAILIVLLTISILIATRRQEATAPGQEARVVISQQAPPASAIPASSGAVALRPLPVSLKSATHEWTQGDGSDPAIIEKLAHNPDEFIRMVEENDRIKRRQLVYRQDTAAAAVQRARAAGETVGKLTLPGLDGREIDFEITSEDLSPSGQSGTFTGRVAGKPQSLVTLAFKFGREAFSVTSPEDGLYLEAEPREPGQIVVKAIDPATYTVGRCGTPEHQSN